MNIRCLLVDDEPLALKVLKKHISNIQGLEVVGVCHNAVEALDVMYEKTIDLIFLDIKMPKLLGTNFLKNLPNPPKVIFVTAYRDYALEGFELDAIDYLVKPVSFERFVKSVSKVKRLMGFDASVLQSEFKKNTEAFVYLRVDKTMQKIFVNEIMYVESWKDYVKIFLTGNRNILVKQSIGSTQNLLSEHSFLRIHRSYIVSIEKISGYNSNAIQLDSKEIPVGRLFKQHVMDVINENRMRK